MMLNIPNMESFRSFILSLLVVVAIPFTLDAQNDRAEKGKEDPTHPKADSASNVHPVEVKNAPIKEAEVQEVHLDSAQKKGLRKGKEEKDRPIHPEKERSLKRSEEKRSDKQAAEKENDR